MSVGWGRAGAGPGVGLPMRPRIARCGEEAVFVVCVWRGDDMGPVQGAVVLGCEPQAGHCAGHAGRLAADQS